MGSVYAWANVHSQHPVRVWVVLSVESNGIPETTIMKSVVVLLLHHLSASLLVFSWYGSTHWICKKCITLFHCKWSTEYGMLLAQL